MRVLLSHDLSWSPELTTGSSSVFFLWLSASLSFQDLQGTTLFHLLHYSSPHIEGDRTYPSECADISNAWVKADAILWELAEM